MVHQVQAETIHHQIHRRIAIQEVPAHTTTVRQAILRQDHQAVARVVPVQGLTTVVPQVRAEAIHHRALHHQAVRAEVTHHHQVVHTRVRLIQVHHHIRQVHHHIQVQEGDKP